MAVTTQRPTQIAGDRPDIGALAAFGLENGLIRFVRDENEPMNDDFARRDFELRAPARQIVGTLAADLDRRIGRRGLLDRPEKARQHRRDLARRRTNVGFRDDLALGVVGIGLFAPFDRETIGLGPVLDDGNRLGRFAESDRQDARRQRVECAGMARLLGVEEIFDLRDRLGRGDADRFVQIDPAVDLGARRAALFALFCASGRLGRFFIAHGLQLRVFVQFESSFSSSRKSRATSGVLRIASIRACASKVSSKLKRSSGANFKLTRWATSMRSSFLCCASAASVFCVSFPPSGMTVTVASLRSGDMRTLGIVTTWRSSTGSATSPRDRISAKAWRIDSATRSRRCEGLADLESERGMVEITKSLERKAPRRRRVTV